MLEPDFGTGFILILTIISLGVIISYIWLTVFNTKPTTTFTAQINTIGSEDKDYFMESRRRSNLNNEVIYE